MKKTLPLVIALLLSVFNHTSIQSQNTVTVSGSSNWIGYANVFQTNGTTYEFGSAWALADLKSVVNVPTNTITLYPNFNTYVAGDAYWANGALGNKIFEGNTFVENASLAGQTLTFNGNVTSNTLAAGYTAIAFIKGLNPNTGYSADVNLSVPLVAGQSFSVSTGTAIPTGLIVQYGFMVRGLNGNPVNEAALGNVVVNGNVSVPTEPLTAAPTPTIPAANVISMFSNAYTNVTVDTWQTSWSAGVVADVQIAGNDTKKYTNLDFVGIETVTNQINATSMSYFHVDVWTPNMTTFRVKLVDFGANAAFGGGDDVEHELIFTPTLSGWNSYHIPLADFTGLTTRAHIAQLILSGLPVGAGTLFVDNVYFSTQALSVASFDKVQVKMYPNPTSSLVTFEAPSVINSITFYNMLGQQVLQTNPNTSNSTVDITQLQNGVYIVKSEIDGVVATSRIVKK